LDVIHLLDLDPGQAVVIVDAAVGVAPGEIVVLPLEGLGRGGPSPASSHALPIDQVLGVAAALRGGLPSGSFVGIGGSSFAPGAPFSPAVREGLTSLTKAIAASGGDLKARQRLEDIEILRKQEQIAIAEKRAAASGDEDAQQLVGQLQQDLNRYELEVFNARSERYPNDLEAKFQLGIRLRKAGNYREAIPVLSAAVKLDDRQVIALLELGECLQRTKQYDTALESYLRAVTVSLTSEDVELQKLARYRCGTLAAGLHNYHAAEEHLSALVAIDPAYKDAATRLDKIREIRHKG
ncbi:MAG: tetratricopeptide repeat protein, partial [Planctomycetia bacterium]|nr:tetratricopeptide repeat protein [Planctomycetia bacterium]